MQSSSLDKFEGLFDRKNALSALRPLRALFRVSAWGFSVLERLLRASWKVFEWGNWLRG